MRTKRNRCVAVEHMVNAHDSIELAKFPSSPVALVSFVEIRGRSNLSRPGKPSDYSVGH